MINYYVAEISALQRESSLTLRFGWTVEAASAGRGRLGKKNQRIDCVSIDDSLSFFGF
jgi:hypothetical protein